MSARQHPATGAAAINTSPIYVTIKEYCEEDTEGLNTGKRLAEQVDGNPNSPTYEQKRIIVVSLNSQFCPVSRTPLWIPTKNYNCLKDDNGNYTAFRENEEEDVNRNSDSHGKTRFVNVGKDFNACPLPQWPFVRILADFQPSADSADSYRIAARIKDAKGNIYIIEANNVDSKNNYAEISLPFGDYLLTKVETLFSAKFAAKHYLKRIFAAKAFEESFTQKSPENKIVAKKCLYEKELNIPFALTNDNRAIHFEFDIRVAEAATTYKATRTADFTRNNCPPDSYGTSVKFTKEYISLISQDDADSIARNDKNFNDAGQFYANDGAASGSTCILIPKKAVITLEIIEPPQQTPQLGRRYGYKISSNVPLTKDVVVQAGLHYQRADDPVDPKKAVITLEIIEPPQQTPQLGRRYGYKISSTVPLTKDVVVQAGLHYQQIDDPFKIKKPDGPDGPVRWRPKPGETDTK